jgi:hypothetical protein
MIFKRKLFMLAAVLVMTGCGSNDDKDISEGFVFYSYQSENMDGTNLTKHTFNNNGNSIIIVAPAQLGISKDHISIGGKASVTFSDTLGNWAEVSWLADDEIVQFEKGGGTHIEGVIKKSNEGFWVLE